MDVKPGNVFLDEDFNARLGDPGMAQELPMEFSYASISQIRGTEGYMDEYLQDRHFKPVNDIFAFGVGMTPLNCFVLRISRNSVMFYWTSVNMIGSPIVFSSLREHDRTHVAL